MLKLENRSMIYKDLSMETLGIIQRLNEQREATFLIPTRFISSENAQLAYMLNEYYNLHRNESDRKVYRSFFVNSRYEALQGAIKLMRHNGLLKKKNKILILDPENDFKFVANPLDEEKEEDFLIPGLTFVSSLKLLNEQINQSNSIIGVILRNTNAGYPHSECSSIIKLCKEKGIITLWDDPDHDPSDKFLLHEFSLLTDMVILGESFTDYEVPFSLFSMSVEVHKPWTSAQTCLLHSSTYSGNKLAVIKAIDTMSNKIQLFTKDKRVMENCNKINSSIEETIKCFSDYVNPGMVKFYTIIGYDFLCKKSLNSRLSIENSRGEHEDVIDAVSGGGAAVRGHCPEDIVKDVLKKHVTSINYWDKLREKLQELFSFPHAFPAISGATAVENAYILTLLASQNKKRIIVFKGNFAGNTLISHIGTANKVTHKIFQPFYKNVMFIDPLQPDSEKILLNELGKGDIGLVWLEIFQGGTVKGVPENILKVIQDNKKKQGYYVGVDEILMGFYRIDKLASYQETVLQPDVITFSKALSDGTYPMAVTLVSEEIYNRAYSRSSKVVSTLENLYKNQFGAHVALNSIEKLTSPDIIEKTKKVSKILKEGLEEVKKSSPYLKDIYGKGHIYRLCYKNSILSTYFCKRALQEENIFIYIDRIVVANTISEEDVHELINRLKRLYLGVGNPFVFSVKSIFISTSILFKLLF